MQIISNSNIIIFFIIVWLVTTTVTILTGWTLSKHSNKTTTPAFDISIDIIVTLFVGVAVSESLWLLLGVLMMRVPNIAETIIFHFETSLLILITIAFIFYPRIIDARKHGYRQFTESAEIQQE